MRKNDFYGNWNQSGITEIDLRQELIKTLDGSCPELSKSQPGLIRRFRRDASNERIRCSCVDPVTNEPPRERRCTTCLGEGYQWDEVDVDLYHAEVNTESQRSDRETLKGPGIMNTPLRVFYMAYSATLTEDDKLVLLELDKEGKVFLPKTRFELYKLSALTPMRLDNGRLEFWKANGYKDNNKHI